GAEPKAVLEPQAPDDHQMGRAIRTRGCDPILATLLQPLNGPCPRQQVRLCRRKLIARHSRTRGLGYFGYEGRALMGFGAHLCLRLFALHVTSMVCSASHQHDVLW